MTTFSGDVIVRFLWTSNFSSTHARKYKTRTYVTQCIIRLVFLNIHIHFIGTQVHVRIAATQSANAGSSVFICICTTADKGPTLQRHVRTHNSKTVTFGTMEKKSSYRRENNIKRWEEIVMLLRKRVCIHESKQVTNQLACTEAN